MSLIFDDRADTAEVAAILKDGRDGSERLEAHPFPMLASAYGQVSCVVALFGE